MANFYNATNVRRGDTIEFEGEIYKVLATTHITPGKGNAVVQIKMRNIKTGLQREQRFRSVESIKQIEIDLVKMEYLYEDGEMAHFMNHETYEQLAVSLDRLANELKFLQSNAVVMIQTYEGEIVGVSLPKTVDLAVVECAPHVKGATATNQNKPAKLENGMDIRVPGFIEPGTVIRVDTETGEYVERVR
jgi:elongation factor P